MIYFSAPISMTANNGKMSIFWHKNTANPHKNGDF